MGAVYFHKIFQITRKMAIKESMYTHFVSTLQNINRMYVSMLIASSLNFLDVQWALFD